MSRRERRALEEQGATASTSASIPAPPVFPLPPMAPTPPAPAPEPAPVPPPPELSRRERRQVEQAVQAPSVPAGYEYPGTPAATAPLSSGPVGLVPASPVVPLPPVFAAPATGSTTVMPFSDAIPIVTRSRRVGDLSPTTSSLILPETPTIDIAGPLGNTGEIVVTGQIRLPQTLSEMGSLPALVPDRDDDEVMDAYVTGAIAANAKPMRASQAVSGKGDDSDIILVRRARWGTAAVVTSLGAAVLGLAAVALLVLAVMTDVLG